MPNLNVKDIDLLAILLSCNYKKIRVKLIALIFYALLYYIFFHISQIRHILSHQETFL